MTSWQWRVFTLSWIVWIVFVGIYFPLSITLSFAIPIFISFVTVLVDEMADLGAQFLADTAAIKFACNIQWAMMVFYFTVSESALVSSSRRTHQIAVFCTMGSLAMALTSSAAIRKKVQRAKWIAVIATTAALVMAFYFGRLLKPEPESTASPTHTELQH